MIPPVPDFKDPAKNYFWRWAKERLIEMDSAQVPGFKTSRTTKGTFQEPFIARTSTSPVCRFLEASSFYVSSKIFNRHSDSLYPVTDLLPTVSNGTIHGIFEGEQTMSGVKWPDNASRMPYPYVVSHKFTGSKIRLIVTGPESFFANANSSLGSNLSSSISILIPSAAPIRGGRALSESSNGFRINDQAINLCVVDPYEQEIESKSINTSVAWKRRGAVAGAAVLLESPGTIGSSTLWTAGTEFQTSVRPRCIFGAQFSAINLTFEHLRSGPSRTSDETVIDFDSAILTYSDGSTFDISSYVAFYEQFGGFISVTLPLDLSPHTNQFATFSFDVI